jgi:hypothetical protein
MASLSPGDRLAGRLRLVRRLASGATAECWLAEDLVAAARRVLKIAVTPGARLLLAHEAELLTTLAHPGLVASHGTAADGAWLVLMTEYLPGGDLRELCGGAWRDAVGALEPALAALGHAHARGIAHGDLKPANLVRGADGRARLVDVGVAAATLAGATARGSPYSRSPAQWRGARPAPADDLYGLGALLYELVGGAPPFYPSVDARRVAREVPPPPRGAPPALELLIARLLAKDPAARGDLDDARATLAALAGPAAEPLRPPQPLAAALWRPAPAAPAPRRPRWRRPALLAAPLLLAAAVAVFYALPRWVRSHPAVAELAAPVRAPATGASAARPLPSTAQGLTELARRKTRAEDARASFEAARAPLERGHADRWGGADYARLTGVAGEAEARYAQRDYAAAAEAWEAASGLAARVAAARAPALTQALAAGRVALGRGDAAAATAAFGRALAVEPGDAAARAGLARAQHLDAALSLVDAGAALERRGELGAAAQRYRAALAADPANAVAAAALARVATRARADDFAQAMAQGQKALAAGERAAARAAFGRALALEPGAAAARDALAQLAVDEQGAALAADRAAAEAAVREERWADALRAYRAALALDSTLVFAELGEARAEPRAGLAARLERLLAAPAALATADGRAGARALLAEADEIAAGAGPAPVLHRQIAALERALRAAEAPLPVRLVSDNLTEVAVDGVGPLGTFGARELALPPGRYTIVGRRAGFREVRRELEVAPGVAAPPLDVRCTEPI